MTTTKPFQLGSVSTGTLRPEDLLPNFQAELGTFTGLDDPNADLVNMRPDKFATPRELVDWVMSALNEYCPPFVYFGAHPGDGADFGFWPDHDALQEALQYSRSLDCDCELDENGHDYGCGSLDMERRLIDADTTGQAYLEVHVNDHGNVTVMDMDRNVLWSTV